MAPLTPFQKAPYGIVDVSEITLDYSRDKNLTDFALEKLKTSYQRGMPSPQDRFGVIASHYAYDAGHAQRVYDGISKQWFMPATPIASNGGTKHGLPASCFVNEAADTLRGLAGLYKENMFLASRGGGIGTYYGNLRSIGELVGENGHTSGIMPFMHVMDSLTLAISQGCVDGDTEILTENGFVKFSELNTSHGRVWQVESDGKASLVTPSEYHAYPYNGVMHHYVTTTTHGDTLLEQFVTPNHRLVKTDRGMIMDKLVPRFEILQSEDYIPEEDAAFVALHPDQVGAIQDDTVLGHQLAYFENTTRNEVQFDGTVYCVSVPSGMFVARKNNTMFVTGNSLRRGSAAVYLPMWHPEIEEFIDMRRPTGGDLNRKNLNLHHGVLISNAFMEQVEVDGDWELKSPHSGETIRVVSARSLWIRLLLARMEQGEPYIIFEDRVNELMPEYQRKVGLCVKTSNLCVHGDTTILTRDGERRIADLAGQVVDLWNGQEWSSSKVEQTSLSSTMRTICFSNGKSLRTTDHHKFYCDFDGVETEVRAADLSKGDVLWKWKLPDDSEHSVYVTEVLENTHIGPTYCANEPKRHRITLEGIETGNCSEITLPTGIDQYGKDRTAVCFLASFNLETYDEWKDNEQFKEDVFYFMDAVVQDMIDNAPPEMANAVYGASRERAIGVGVMGWHSFLQKNGIPFESVIAKVWNKKIFKDLRATGDAASYKLAMERGSCPDAADAGIVERFSCKIAVAPTASISIICNEASPGIDPIAHCLYMSKTSTGSREYRNRHLVKLLTEIGRNTEEVWSSIRVNKGSVQHLDFLDQEQKDVYKTAFEIDQRWVVEHAADRVPYICQSQPVNLFLPPDINKFDLHAIHMTAYYKGLKSLYYCRSHSVLASDAISGEVVASAVRPQVNYEECLSCQ